MKNKTKFQNFRNTRHVKRFMLKDKVSECKIFTESLRMYPPLPFLDRICTDSDGYSLEPYDNFNIPHKMPIIIPVFSIHRDPKHWPNPTKFDPDRFSVENKDKIVPYTYLPLGAGPHNCIGERFGLLQMKVGLINLFKNHYVTPTEIHRGYWNLSQRHCFFSRKAVLF